MNDGKLRAIEGWEYKIKKELVTKQQRSMMERNSQTRTHRSHQTCFHYVKHITIKATYSYNICVS